MARTLVRWSRGLGFLAALAVGGASRDAFADPCIVALSGGGEYALGLRDDASVLSWGNNPRGQLGTGQVGGYSSVPVEVGDMNGVVAVSAGGSHSLALRDDGSVWAWGGNSSGQLGIGGTAPAVPDPTEVRGLPPVVAIEAGHSDSMALSVDGTVWMWGFGSEGELGNGTSDSSDVPVQVPDLTEVEWINSGHHAIFAVRSDGTLWAWGSNRFGQLGLGDTLSRNRPTQVNGLGSVREVGGGFLFTLAVTTDGQLWAWGINDYGQLGDGTRTNSTVPIPVAGLVGHTLGGGSSAGFARTLAPDGRVWTWGTNERGQLGNPTGSTLPQPVPDLGPIVALEGGGVFTHAIDATGAIWAWGLNWAGHLGDGTTTDAPVPVRVVAPASDPVPPDQGNVLRAVRQARDVRLEFAGAPATVWRLFRDDDPLALGSTELRPDATTPEYLDTGAVDLAPALLFYRIKGLSECFRAAGP